MALISAQEYLDRGVKFLQEGNLKEAELIFNRLLNQDYNNKFIIYYLAGVHAKKGENGQARQLFKRVVEIDPNFSEAWNNLGCINRNIPGLMNEALQCFEKALQIHDFVPEYLLNYGSAIINTGQPQKALEIIDKVLKLDLTNQEIVREKALYNKSLCLLELGRYGEAWDLYGYRWVVDDKKDKVRTYGGLPEWNGQKGVKIVVRGEQGLGDEIMFLSMAKDLMKDNQVIIEVNPRLASLFKNSFPNTMVFGTKLEKSSELEWVKIIKPEYRIASGDLGKFFRREEKDFDKTPFIKAETRWIEYAKEKLKDLDKKKLKIGISWKGGVQTEGHCQRLITLEKWLPILENENCEFVSLQYNSDSYHDIEKLQKLYPKIKIHHWQDMASDIDKLAGLIHNLDLIISVPQTAVHLAGAMGKKVWQLNAFKAMWQAGVNGKDMPWYDSVKSYWQENDGNWEKIINKVNKDLCEFQKNTKN